MEPLQERIYEFIVAYIEKCRMGPSLREIDQGVGTNSLSVISSQVDKLVERGLLTRKLHTARSIQLTHQPARPPAVPLFGTTAAGPLLDQFPVDHQPLQMEQLLQLQGKHVFALHVRGDSMIDADIHDGDYALFTSQSSCQNGDIVVVMHKPSAEQCSVTLKRLYKERDHVRLQPANAAVQPLLIPQDEWEREWSILGKFITALHIYDVSSPREE